jgi:hypothetical protein
MSPGTVAIATTVGSALDQSVGVTSVVSGR